MCTVCVAKEWWKIGVNYQGLQLTNNSIKHGTILAFDGIIQLFNFSTYKKGKITTILGQKEMQKCRKIDFYYIYHGEFTKFSTFEKRSKQQASKYTKMGFIGHVVQVKSKSKV